MRSLPVCLLGAMGSLLLLGCTPGYPETSPVHGTVTLDGKPLEGGTVQFFSSQGQTASGEIDADGNYRLTTFQPDDGAVPGAYRVAVQPPQVADYFGGTPLVVIPDHYMDPATAGLTAEVHKGINRIDWPLDSDEE